MFERIAVLVLAWLWYAEAAAWERVEMEAAEHDRVLRAAIEASGSPPAELWHRLSVGDSPRWRSDWWMRWPVEDLGGGWRRVRRAVCSERVALRCHHTLHTAPPGTHELVEHRVELDRSVLAPLFAGVRIAFPGHDIHEVVHVTVEDGSAWSAQRHGFHVRLAAPPDFAGGPIVRFLRGSAGSWAPRPYTGRGRWSAGTAGAAVAARARASGLPPLEVMVLLEPEQDSSP
ncbi:MAG: hypothetical protein V2J24_14055 [Pseudomonadales bacterium]|jgi:hypothetical protein|nr:hypothetical protein [Pseudomonadales bacterium]